MSTMQGKIELSNHYGSFLLSVDSKFALVQTGLPLASLFG